MAHAYTPGLTVARRTEIRKRRILPLKGDVLVEKGDRVAADQIVARAFLPGPVTPVNIAQKLGVPAEDVPKIMLVREGDHVEPGTVVARSAGFFGLFRNEVTSPVAGEIESISQRTGQVMIRREPQPLQLDAYVDGEVSGVMPGDGVEIVTTGSLVQGIFGVGGERRGRILVLSDNPDDVLTAERIPETARGAVVVGGSYANAEAFRRAQAVGASCLVVGGSGALDLHAVLGYDLGVAITGQEAVESTLILTEGFGRIRMAQATFELLKDLEGRAASVNGATQIRAGVMRPEIVVPAGAGTGPQNGAGSSGIMEIGSTVRVIREPFFGRLGRVTALPPEPVTIETGARVRVLKLALEGGQETTLPRANVELMEGRA